MFQHAAAMAARLLGHCDVKMLTKVYKHTTVDTLRETIASTKRKKRSRALTLLRF